ncbi:ABC transporter substrate-binding protein [Azospirillum melinis]|uniref:ABC transporter substrate-binding protein n=1 Tax=Azospirillum melinis TaxID=328839 RepID=UPI001AE5EF06|nr:ABC transporter substrate-binding protein [Azospirillum melinis]MBP2305808.1 peptide/nickel transport system substrate-binding protein [Azospirillum melinis]
MDRRTFLGAMAGLVPTAAFAQTTTAPGASPTGTAPTTTASSPRSLSIGAISAPNSLDPQFYQSPTNNQTLRQIFDPLVTEDAEGRVRPLLAQSWRAVDELTWEFKLRPGIRFHDGTPLTPDDIAFTVERVPAVPNSPGSFVPYVRNIAAVEPIDATTFRIRTKTPNPYLDRDFTNLYILSRRIHAGAATADFTAGKLAVGTGAFRYAGFTVGQQIELERNPDFWGTPTGWNRVRTRFIPDAGARVAGLLSGDLDLIDGVPVQDVAHLAADPRLAIFSVASATSVYLFPDASRDQSPFVTDRTGKPLDHNPLKDVRVRQALSLAIDRKGIVEKLLLGQGTAADQFAPPPAPDRLPGRPTPAADPARARQLLAEAGYPDGFGLTIHGPSGFFTSDVAVLQAVAQGFSRIGVDTKVETLPIATFFSRATNREFALFMTTYATTNSAELLRQVALTRNPDTGAGPFNRQHYSNPKVDTPLLEALRTFDPERRVGLIREALAALDEDAGIIPVFFPRFNWAGRKTHVRFIPGNAFGHTNAVFTEPV